MAKTEEKATGEAAPRRKRGRPKGYPKTGGRKPKVTYATRSDVAGHLLPKWAVTAEAILDGVPLHVSGPTGKPQRRIATMDEKISVLRMIGNKVMADLQSSTLKAEVEVRKDPAEIRPLARAVLGLKEAVDILKLAEITDEPVAEPFVDPRPAPHQLLLGRDPIIELTANSDAGPSTSQALSNGGSVGVTGSADPSSFSSNTSSATSGELSDGEANHRLAAASPTPDKPLEHGDKVYIESNGAHCWWDQNRKKYAVFDNNNVFHGWRTDRAVALAHAESLPRGDQVHYQQHPFASISAQAIADEPRRDNRGYLPRTELKIVRQRPR